MTESEIIDAAREAGWTGVYVQWAEPTGKPDYSPMRVSLTVPVTMGQIQRFTAIISAKQKEKDARIAARYATGAAHAIRGQE